jgi:hypothetical protein
MDNKQQLDIAKNQLNIVLSFFPRVDSQASVILAIDTAMIATLTSNAPSLKSFELFEWHMLFVLISVALIFFSIYHLYLLAYPRLPGAENKSRSLIYFKHVAEEKNLDNYQKSFAAQAEEDYVKDLVGQIWRNSQILNEKYKHLKLAFICLAASLIPWMISLAMFASKNVELKNLLVK